MVGVAYPSLSAGHRGMGQRGPIIYYGVGPFGSCVVAAAKNKGALALGNIIGSNISNILLILGVSALACPLTFANMKVVDLGVITLSSVMLLVSAWTGRDNKISRWDGASYLLIFAAYMAYLILTI